MSNLVLRVCAAFVCRLGDTRRGATAVEYGLLLALIVCLAMSALTMFSGATQGLYNMFVYIAGLML